MAGRGFPPGDSGRLAGHGAAKARAAGMRVITAEPVSQPELPVFDVTITVDDQVLTQTFRWPERTREWWQMWADSPLSTEFTSTDWSELLDTALLHARFWGGDHKVANELRLRVANFGATPADRARLRIQFAAADEAEERRKVPTSSARGRRGPLKSA